MARSRSSKHRRSRRGHRGNNLLVKIIIVVAIVLIPTSVLGIGGYFAIVEFGKEKITANYCFRRKDQYVAAFFVDFSHTQDSSNSQKRDLVNAIEALYDRLPPNGQLAVFTTARGGVATVNRPELTICKPPRTDAEMKRIGAPGGSAQRLDRQYKEARAAFEAGLDDLITRSVQNEQQAVNSPILEQIRGISRYDFGAPLSHLTIFTDGIQNSAIAQFCRIQGHLPRFERFAQRPDYREIRPDNFGGASVEVLLLESFPLPGPGAEFCTHGEVRAFYRDLFKANGAGSVRITPLGFGAGQ